MQYRRIVETSDAQMQIDKFNRAGPMVIRESDYDPQPGMNLLVVVCVLADGQASEDADLDALVTAVEASPSVYRAADPIVVGTAPVILINQEVPEPTHQVRLFAAAALSAAYADRPQSHHEKHNLTPPAVLPEGKTWMLLPLVLVAPLDAASRAALVSFVEGVDGIDSCTNAIEGSIPADVTGPRMQLETRMRIDSIPVPEP